MEHVTGDMIWKFLSGEDLADDELDLIALHISECGLCAKRLANMAELCESLPEILPLQAPSADLADRIMDEIAVHGGGAEEADGNTLPHKSSKKRSPRLELFTRLATAAVVTGFLMLGSAGPSYAEQVPVVGKTIAAVSNTGNLFADGTARVYSELHYLFSVVSFDLSR
jgi:hypothetical protein